jgi:hypothetical protein
VILKRVMPVTEARNMKSTADLSDSCTESLRDEETESLLQISLSKDQPGSSKTTTRKAFLLTIYVSIVHLFFWTVAIVMIVRQVSKPRLLPLELGERFSTP